MQLLLSQSASPNLVDDSGVAAIHLAAGKEKEKNTRCLKILLQFGADPNLKLVHLHLIHPKMYHTTNNMLDYNSYSRWIVSDHRTASLLFTSLPCGDVIKISSCS